MTSKKTMTHANQLALSGNYEEAICIYKELLTAQTDDIAVIHGNLGAMYNALQDPENGLSHSTLAIKYDGDRWQYWLNKSTSLLHMERLEEAKLIVNKLLDDGINEHQVMLNKARIEFWQGNYRQSIRTCIKGLRLDRSDSKLLNCLADNLSAINKNLLANTFYKKALAVNPNDSLANWNYSLFELRHGHYISGWTRYTWGFFRRKSGRGVYRYNLESEWQGQKTTETLYIWGEQGVGDQIMFMKFAKYAINFSSNIVINLDKRITPILKNRYENINGISFSDVMPENPKYQIPIGNLPKLFWNYFEKDCRNRESILRRSIKVNSTGEVRVGIAWRGGIGEKAQLKRSIPLGVFNRISTLKAANIKIVMLQYNPLQTEIDFLKTIFSGKISLPQYDAYEDLLSWVDHIDSCDLLVSVDNSAIHFAGSLGLTTLTILPSSADFRWGLDPSSNIWYESVELLRGSDQKSLDELAIAIDNWILRKIKGFKHER